MKETVWKRPLALLLAFSMMAPAAMALAPGQGPLNVELEETVAAPPEENVSGEDGQVAVPEKEQEESAFPAVISYAKYKNLLMSGGMATTIRNYGEFFELDCTDDYFAVEGDWLDSADTSQIYGTDGNYYFSPMTKVKDMGNVRVPDHQWVGWREKADYYDVNGDPISVAPEKWTGDKSRDVEPVAVSVALNKVTIPSVASKPDDKKPTMAVVGVWEPSQNPNLTELNFTAEGIALPLYTTDILGLPLPSTGSSLDTATDGVYYLRVPADQKTIDLSFVTAEPYYDFLGKSYTAGGNLLTKEQTLKSPVQVTLNTGAVPQMTYQRTTEMEGVPDGGGGVVYYASNRAENPARARWSLAQIPLTPSAAGNYYNDLTVTMTAPDGKAQRSYTFRIQRLTAPQMSRNPGNTPYGQIRREAGWTDVQKAAEQADFEKNLQYTTKPDGLSNAYLGKFYDGAFVSKYSPDTDEKAVVVYQNSNVTLPGISLTDTKGDPVDLTKGSVKRTVALTVADTLSEQTVVGNQRTGTYVDTAVLQKADGSDGLDLTERTVAWSDTTRHPLRVVPGVYTLVYTYTDAADQKEYSNESVSFPAVGQGHELEFERTLVVLPRPGDVDMDGALTHEDGVKLGEIADRLSQAAIQKNERKAIYALRVCDLNRDGQVSQADATLAQKGFIPHGEKPGGDSDYFYVAQPDTVTASRIPTNATGNKATLSLNYRGMAAGKRDFAAEDAFGATAATARTVPKKTGDSTLEKISNGQTFWLGVTLDNAAALGLANNSGNISRFTVALTYDASLIRPAGVLTGNEIAELGASGDTPEELWLNTVKKVSFSKDAGTIFDCTTPANLYQPMENTRGAAPFFPLPSMAISPLEQATEDPAGATKLQNLRQVLLTISTADMNAKPLVDGDLLFLPFTLVKFPYGKTELSVADLVPAMTYLAFTTKEGTTYAYDGRDAGKSTEFCYGGATRNLAPLISFPQSGTAAVPLGENDTKTNITYTATYGCLIDDSRDTQPAGTIATGQMGQPLKPGVQALPPGVTYESTSGLLKGMPTAAGTYYFYLGDSYYVEFVVEKAPVRIYPHYQTTYYGETLFRNGDSTAYTYSYYPEDIKKLDTDKTENAGKNDGSSANLPNMVGKLPEIQFYAADKNGSAVTAKTDIGTYPVVLFGSTHETGNYTLSVAAAPNGSTASLTILPRPVRLTAVNGRTDSGGKPVPVKTIYDTDQPLISGEDLRATTAAGEMGAQLVAELPPIAEGKYDGYVLTAALGPVLTGDSLAIRYSGAYTQSPADTAMETATKGATKFDLGNQFSDTRTVTISGVTWLESNSKNYKRVDTATAPATQNLVGTVTRQGLRSVRIISEFSPLQFEYGAPNQATASLKAEIFRGTAQNPNGSGTIPYATGGNFADRGMWVSWVTKAQRDAGLAELAANESSADDEVKGTVSPENAGIVGAGTAGDPYRAEVPFAYGEEFSVAVHNGRYLCVYSQGMRREGGKQVTVAAYSAEPITVTPRTLHLTVEDATRYYGEANGTFTNYKFEPLELSSRDRKALQSEPELFRLPGVVEGVSAEDQKNLIPTVAAPEAGANHPITTPETPISIQITPGTAAGSIRNYNIAYTGGKLHIARRPIVVDEIKKEVLATLFADTKQIQASGQQMNYLSDASPATCNFTLKLPKIHTAQSTTFYTRSASGAVVQSMGFGTDAAVLKADEDKLALQYTLRVLPDNGKRTSFANGHFKMDAMGGDGTQKYDVEVGEIALVAAGGGTAADEAAAELVKNNYSLVFNDKSNADKGFPNCTVAQSAPAFGSETEINYFVPGQWSGNQAVKGGVKCAVAYRPLKALQIVNLPKLDYAYGETFQPATKPFDRYPDGTRCDYPLRVYAEYADTLPGALNLLDFSQVADRSEYVPFKMSSASATTFDERGLTIYEKSADGTLEKLTANQFLNVADTGKSLVVKGKRSVTDSEITSTDRLPGNDTRPNRLTVTPKKITVKIGNSYRYYGEENVLNVAGAGESCDAATLRWADLAAQDQKKFPGMKEKSTIPLTEANCTTLGIITLPKLQTTANAGTAVPQSGGFPITAAEVALSGNYTATCTPGTLSIYPRPIRIQEIIAGKDNPLYTIYDNTKNRTFKMDLGDERYTFQAPSAENAYNNGIQSGDRTLPLSRIALRSGDKLATKVQVQFTKTGDFGETDVAGAEVVVSGFTLPQGQKQNSNYFLWDQAQNTQITGDYGAVKIRGIERIEIISDPAKSYTYGDTLQLGDLKVQVTLKKLNVETAEQVTVPYVGPDQFASYGLFVNYIKESTLREQNNAYYASLVAGRKAAGGDHLTVALTHDTQPENVPDFTPNGKYLVVSAKLQENTEYAVPIILSGAISVAPRTLLFDLAATDKTYDEKRNAVGSLTLQNVFPADVVYVKTGASYEDKGVNFADYTDYVNHIKNGYVFTTGTYGNPENRLNPYLTYTDPKGYDKSLTFAFHDENVAYEAPPTPHTYGPLTTRSLDVSKIQLGGPDAANYTIVEKVTAENLTAAKAGGYQGADLPRATIHKAKQEDIGGALPTVQLENHSNAVRISYSGPSRPGIDAKPSDSLADGFHYEYALQMDDPTLQQDKTPTGFRQWAGDDGEQLFQDTLYFGGEFVVPTPPAGYVPEKQDVPEFKEGDLRKGQLYPWDEADGGVEQDKEHYPGGAEYVYEGYKLYKSARKALPRNAVLWGVARVAETHNYLPSRPISSVAGLGAEQAQGYTEKTAAVALAEQKLAENPGDEALLAKYQSALADRRNAGAAAVSAVKVDRTNGTERATSDAAERVAALELLADKGQWPKEQPMIAATTAVKTFTERLDVLSTAEKRGSDAKDLTVTTLEALWFTDLLTYPETKYLDAALWNNEPVRYYGYFWDKDRSAALKFDDKEHPLSLAAPFEVEIDRKTENGSEKVMVPVNEQGIAQIYVNLNPPSSGGARKIIAQPDSIVAALGDKPVQITIIFMPATVQNKRVRWETSNAKVATVNEKNQVTFVGVGECILTATSQNKKTATVSVKVTERPPARFPMGSFNEGFSDAYFEVDKDNLFYPNKMMTRGELAVLLAKFYRANVLYTASGKAEFPDMPSDEEIADAVALLASKGILRGTEDGRVCTDEIATRGEIVTMLAQMLALDTTDSGGPYAYKDSGKGQTWAYRYIDAMEKAGLLGGVGDGYFAPERGLTRAEAAAFLARLLDDIGAAGMLSKPPADVPPDHWGYPAILRAITNLTPPEKPAEGKGNH